MDVFAILPESIQQQLFLERDPHGNVQVSLIESEKLFSALSKTSWKKEEKPAHITESSMRSTTSSVTKEDAHSRQTSTLTTAIP